VRKFRKVNFENDLEHIYRVRWEICHHARRQRYRSDRWV